MTVQRIDGNNIYNYFISGAHNLIRWEQNLNRINVFPVPDGDTGTNLAMTMRTIITKAKKHGSLHESLNSISEIAVENAYGNSGMIFAQYLSGFATEAGPREQVSAAEFGDIAAAAARYAYEAVVHPKEGTILSVMKDWAAELRRSLLSSDFEQSISDSVEKARHMVQQTREKMKVLRDAGVVDAGAKGFLIFLEGMLAYLKSGRILESEQAAQEELKTHVNLVPQADVLQNRFCTQLYIESKRSRRQIAESIDALGDSLVVTQKGSNYSIHIHTDHPETVMDRLVRTDTVRSHRVEDMKRQRDMVHERRHSIAIVTDSIADLPRAFADQQQITVIPIRLICDGVVYLDKVTMTPELFYRRMPEYRMNPTSAQPPISDFEETFEKLLMHYDSIIGIFVSSKMSGTYASALKAAAKKAGGKKISVVDSLQNSAAQGLLVRKAARMLDDGYTHDETVNAIEQAKKRTHIYVSLQDLSNMIRGGRISRTKGFILGVLKLKPVISIDEKGKGSVYKKTLTTKAAVAQIGRKLRHDIAERGIEDYCLVYSNDERQIDAFAADVQKRVGKPPAYVDAIGPVVGLNAGAGAFALAYIKGEGA